MPSLPGQGDNWGGTMGATGRWSPPCARRAAIVCRGSFRDAARSCRSPAWCLLCHTYSWSPLENPAAELQPAGLPAPRCPMAPRAPQCPAGHPSQLQWGKALRGGRRAIVASALKKFLILFVTARKQGDRDLLGEKHPLLPERVFGKEHDGLDQKPSVSRRCASSQPEVRV